MHDNRGGRKVSESNGRATVEGNDDNEGGGSWTTGDDEEDAADVGKGTEEEEDDDDEILLFVPFTGKDDESMVHQEVFGSTMIIDRFLVLKGRLIYC